MKEFIERIIPIICLAIVLIPASIKEQKELKKQWRMEWEAEQKRKQEPRQVFHHLTQAEFEKWKAERDKREP